MFDLNFQLVSTRTILKPIRSTREWLRSRGELTIGLGNLLYDYVLGRTYGTRHMAVFASTMGMGESRRSTDKCV